MVPGAGIYRDGPSPSAASASPSVDCKDECDESALREKLSQIKSQIRRDAARARMLDRDYAAAIHRCDQYRDSIWGPDGSLAEEFRAFYKMAKLGKTKMSPGGAANAVKTGKQFYDKSQKLADDLRDFYLARDEADRIHKERDGIDRDIERLQKEIDDAMKKCADCLASQAVCSSEPT